MVFVLDSNAWAFLPIGSLKNVYKRCSLKKYVSRRNSQTSNRHNKCASPQTATVGSPVKFLGHVGYLWLMFKPEQAKWLHHSTVPGQNHTRFGVCLSSRAEHDIWLGDNVIYLNILFRPHKSHLLQLLSEGIEAIKHTGHTHLVMDFQLGWVLRPQETRRF